MAAKYEIWLADLNPKFGTEPGKKRPVVVVQTDLLNQTHPSTLICPLTTKVIKGAAILRVHLKKGEANLKQASDILVDQVRAIDNRRFLQKVGTLPKSKQKILDENLKIALDLP
jgi:mRNA interferase MazF